MSFDFYWYNFLGPLAKGGCRRSRLGDSESLNPPCQTPLRGDVTSPLWQGGQEIVTKIIPLWQKVFGDSEDFIRSFYELNVDVFTAYDGNKLIGSVNRVSITYNGIFGGYIYAACVDENYRGRGIFKRLLAEAERDMPFMMLIPANEELFGMYRKLCYDRTTYTTFPFECEMIEGEPFDGNYKRLYTAYTTLAENEFIKPFDFFKLAVSDFEIQYYNGGFIIYRKTGKNTIKIYEMYCKNCYFCDIMNKKPSGVYKTNINLPQDMKVNLFLEM